MIGAIILVIFLFLISLPILGLMKTHFAWLQLGLMKKLFWYHILFAVIYYVYVQSAASDSVAYFQRTQSNYANWMDAYGTGTPFIDFLAYPFVNYFGFSYEMMMMLFAWFGFWGFVFFYIVFNENVRFVHKWQGFNLINIIIFLPNMHYWSASLGKGSVIFLGLGMAIFGLSRLSTRKVFLLLALLLIYFIRPHVFFLMALGILAGLVSSKEKVPLYQKLIVLAGIGFAVFYLYDSVMTFAKLDGDNLMDSFDQLSSHRAEELAKAGSGVDLSNYPLPLKLLTFWFRPLFFDAQSLISVIVSFENLFYLLMAAKLIQGGFFQFLTKSSALVKTNGFVFFATSFALSGTLSNLGIIIRQKSMVMYFFLFVIIAFMDYKKSIAFNRRIKIKQKEQVTAQKMKISFN